MIEDTDLQFRLEPWTLTQIHTEMLAGIKQNAGHEDLLHEVYFSKILTSARVIRKERKLTPLEDTVLITAKSYFNRKYINTGKRGSSIPLALGQG